MKDIIEQNRGLIKAIIKKLTGSYNEDIEQEVYIKTWRNMDHYKEQGKFSQLNINHGKEIFTENLKK